MKCKSCGADIKWIKLRTGKSNPVDPYVRKLRFDGGKDILITDDGYIIKGTIVGQEDNADDIGYISHFATCPFASSHRKRNGNG